MRIETIGNRIGFLTGMILFITIFHFVLSLKFEWLPHYLSHYDALYLSVLAYATYLIAKGVYRKWKK